MLKIICLLDRIKQLTPLTIKIIVTSTNRSFLYADNTKPRDPGPCEFYKHLYLI